MTDIETCRSLLTVVELEQALGTQAKSTLATLDSGAGCITQMGARQEAESLRHSVKICG